MKRMDLYNLLKEAGVKRIHNKVIERECSFASQCAWEETFGVGGFTIPDEQFRVANEPMKVDTLWVMIDQRLLPRPGDEKANQGLAVFLSADVDITFEKYHKNGMCSVEHFIAWRMED